MAEYNQLMNQRLYKATSQLSDIEIKEDKGAFFKSIFGTLNHILTGDIIWLNRFYKIPKKQETLVYISEINQPKSLDSQTFNTLSELKTEREKIDDIIIQWISSLSEKDINFTVTYKNMQGIEFRKNLASLINHLFLHQIHHRGQITTLLSQSGVDFGETDLIEIIPNQN